MLKLLGIVWTPSSNDFCYTNLPADVAKTKRGELSFIARLYDMLGLFVFTIICFNRFYGKIHFAMIWQEGCAWDDPLARIILLTFW